MSKRHKRKLLDRKLKRDDEQKTLNGFDEEEEDE
jgi:hypothetical protein